MTGEFRCPTCRDGGWVCENHPDVAWYGMTGDVMCCTGAGTPCQQCSADAVASEPVNWRTADGSVPSLKCSRCGRATPILKFGLGFDCCAPLSTPLPSGSIER